MTHRAFKLAHFRKRFRQLRYSPLICFRLLRRTLVDLFRRRARPAQSHLMAVHAILPPMNAYRVIRLPISHIRLTAPRCTIHADLEVLRAKTMSCRKRRRGRLGCSCAIRAAIPVERTAWWTEPGRASVRAIPCTKNSGA
jgi:hypothetical protein